VVVTNPALFVPDYRLELADEDVAPLGLADPAEAEILVTVQLPRTGEALRLNLRGPILLCPRTRRGVQRVSRDEAHGTLSLDPARPAAAGNSVSSASCSS
jgi:flagellar assembly factor FliW